MGAGDIKTKDVQSVVASLEGIIKYYKEVYNPEDKKEYATKGKISKQVKAVRIIIQTQPPDTRKMQRPNVRHIHRTIRR